MSGYVCFPVKWNAVNL